MNGELSGTANQQFLDQLNQIITGQSPKGAAVELTINPVAQQAAWDALAGAGLTGAVIAHRPEDRRASWRWCPTRRSTRTLWPSHDTAAVDALLRAAARRPDRPADQPHDLGRPQPARIDLQAGHRLDGVRERHQPRQRSSPTRAACSSRRATASSSTRTAAAAGAAARSPWPTPSGSPATSRWRCSDSSSAGARCSTRPRSSASVPASTSRCRRSRASTRGPWTNRRPCSPRSASTRCVLRPFRWRWSRPRSPTEGRSWSRTWSRQVTSPDLPRGGVVRAQGRGTAAVSPQDGGDPHPDDGERGLERQRGPMPSLTESMSPGRPAPRRTMMEPFSLWFTGFAPGERSAGRRSGCRAKTAAG